MARIGEDMEWAIALSCEVASGVRWSSERGRGMMAGQGVKLSGLPLSGSLGSRPSVKLSYLPPLALHHFEWQILV
jgi:hypothetical protein